MNKWFRYTLTMIVDGRVEESIFQGGAIEIIAGRFFQIDGVVGADGFKHGTIMLNFDVVGQLNFTEVTDET